MQFSDVKNTMSNIKAKLRPIFRTLRPFWFPLLFCYLEAVLHYFAYRSFDSGTIWIILFSTGLGFIFTFLTSIFPKKVNSFLTYFFTFLFTLLFEIQTVYFEIFKGFAPVSSVKLGAQAVTNFTGNMIEGIVSSLFWIFVVLMPFICLCGFSIWMRPKFNRPKKLLYRFASLAASVFILLGTVGIMAIFFSGTPSVYMTFSSSRTSTDSSVNYFGLNTTMIQEIRWILFPDSEKSNSESLSDKIYKTGANIDENVDFKALYEKAGDNESLKNLTAELSNMPVTQKNDYTGSCYGYNLISICAEAFSPVFISEELTPTLYKLTNNGFIFDNFYATFPNTTTNGEYAFCTGLYPDMSREKTDSSFTVSSSNYLPYCYGNMFKTNGADAFAYHNYVAEFYYRNFTHPNMGYVFKAANSGLDMEITWPSSDYDMMKASVKDFTDLDGQFVAYYMTFSGHYQYTLTNAMSAKNWDTVKDLPYSEAARAYIACNLELEYALSHLMEQLETAGIADKTVIVLTTDHYPYGLTDEQYAELAGHEIKDVFDKQKNSFICYVPGMDPVHVDEYCSTVDILPTILNLFGFTYDSRLLVGQDVLDPDAQHVAIMADGSFIADGISYDASKIAYSYDNKTDESVALGEELYNAVQKRFSVSTEILNNDYYKFVYDKASDSEKVDDLTSQYGDVGIMAQSPVYFVLKHDIMDPVSETNFGLYENCPIITVIDSMYRVADNVYGNNRHSYDDGVYRNPDCPFYADEKHMDAVEWAYLQGILVDDGLIPYDLNSTITLGQFALILERSADYFGISTRVSWSLLKNSTVHYRYLDERILHASLFCREMNIIIGDGNKDYVFYTSTGTLTKSFVVESIYKLCSFYVMPETK